MIGSTNKNQKSFLKKIIPISAFIGGLCCFTPVVLVLLGLSTAAYAASLSEVLYVQHKWIFRGVALAFLLCSISWYTYKKEKVCTLNQLKKKKRKIINLLLITLILGMIIYVIWLYVIVELIGILLGIWG